MLELLRGPRIKEFNLLKTDGERFKFCKYILRFVFNVLCIKSYFDQFFNMLISSFVRLKGI